MITRCGWCIGGNHAQCIVVVKMGERPKVTAGASYFWQCRCEHSGHPATRCVDCQRPRVKVDESWQCRDQADCLEYRALNKGPFKHSKSPNIEELDSVCP